MEQLLCPYLAKPLTDIASVNDEHVLPIAVGAPTRFYVRASEAENSRLNELIDAPFSNEPMIKFLAMSQGVVSRSGPVIAKVPATLLSTGESVTVAFSQGGFQMKFANPIEMDPVTGLVSGVRGFGDEAMQHALRVQKNYAKKKVRADIGEVISEDRPQLKASLTLNNSIVWRELLKIAYLTTVWCFGDRAINSASGALYRRGLNLPLSSNLSMAKIRGCTQDLPGISARGSANKHVLMCLVLGDDLVTSVKLFGAFAVIFATSSEGIGEEGDGLQLEIDVSSAALKETPALEAVMANYQSLYS